MSERIGLAQAVTDLSANEFASVADNQVSQASAGKAVSTALAAAKDNAAAADEDLISKFVSGFSKDVMLVAMVNDYRLQHAQLLRDIARGQVEDISHIRSNVEALTVFATAAENGVAIDVEKILKSVTSDQMEELLEQARAMASQLETDIKNHTSLSPEEQQAVDKLHDALRASKFKPEKAPENYYGSTVPAQDGLKELLEKMGIDSTMILDFKKTFVVVDLGGNFDGLYKDQHRSFPDGRLHHDDIDALKKAIGYCDSLSRNAEDLVKMGLTEIPSFSDDDEGLQKKKIFLEEVSQKRDSLRDELSILMAQVQTNLKKVQSAIQKLNEDLKKYDELMSKLTEIAESGD